MNEVTIAVNEHPEGYWVKPPKNPPVPLEQSHPESARLLSWLIQENMERKAKGQGPLATVNTYRGQIQVVECGQPARSSDKTGRNEPCPCGSGKKYKKCCGT